MFVVSSPLFGRANFEMRGAVSNYSAMDLCKTCKKF